jgi:hypothetical protein
MNSQNAILHRMGLKELFGRWRRGADDDAFERAREETRMTPYERDVDQEDYEGKKEDIQLTRDFPGAEALDAAGDDLEEKPGSGY